MGFSGDAPPFFLGQRGGATIHSGDGEIPLDGMEPLRLVYRRIETVMGDLPLSVRRWCEWVTPVDRKGSGYDMGH